MLLANIFQHEDFEKLKSQQVYKEERFHVMLIKIKKNETLKPHHAITNAFLIMAEGEIIFTLNEERFHLSKGDMFTFKAFETHSAEAVEDAAFLLIK